MITQVLSALLMLVTLTAVVGSVIRGRTLARRVETRADGRVWLYRNFLLRMWPLMVLPLVITDVSDRVTARDLGWARPHGVAGYLLAAYYLLIVVIASVRIRRAMRRGQVIPQRQRIAFMVPRTARERWWAAALAVTAGVVEETIFRGALYAVGTKVYHLPAVTVLAAALVLFAASHLYQGWRGLIGSGLIGLILTIIFVTSGSLLLAIVVHAAHDLISLLLIPAESADRPPAQPAATTQQSKTAQPAETTHAAETTQAAEAAQPAETAQPTENAQAAAPLTIRAAAPE
jgi:membrane protease YdiL (CAAX protease family)